MVLLHHSRLRDRAALKDSKKDFENAVEETQALLVDSREGSGKSKGFFRWLVGASSARWIPTSQFSTPGEHRTFLLNIIALVIFCCDPPFWMYGIVLNWWLYRLLRSFSWHCHKNNATPKRALVLLSPLGISIFLVFVLLSNSKYHVNHKRNFSYDLTNVQTNHSFYYMRPVDDSSSYSTGLMDKIKTISDYFQETSRVTTLLAYHIEELPVVNVQSFDNAIRFDFLLEFRQNPVFSADFGCLIETDVVVDTAYVGTRMTNKQYKTIKQLQQIQQNRQPLPDVLHIQHMWGKRKFEAENVGLLCVKNKQLSNSGGGTRSYVQETYLDMWLRLMSFLNNRRYCRLLPKSFLYWLAPNRRVLYWDEDKGCTDLYAHCNYIHFTRPKENGIAKAIRMIESIPRMKPKKAMH